MLRSLVARVYVLVALAVTPALVVVWYLGREVERNREAEILLEAESLATMAAAEMRIVVAGVRAKMSSIAEAEQVRRMDPAACSAFLQAVARKSTISGAFLAADRDGAVFCSGTGRPHPSVGERPWVRAAIAENQFTVGLLTVGTPSGAALLPFAQPFLAEDGSVAGTINLGLRLDWLLEQAQRQRLPRGGRLTIADAAGNILVRVPDGAVATGKPVQPALLDLARDGHSGATENIGADGRRWAVGYAAPDMSGGLYVFAALDWKTEVEPYLASARLSLNLLAATAGLALLAAWVGTGRLVRRPLAALLDVATAWRRGELSRRVPDSGRLDELSQLSDTLNTMAKELEEREAARAEASRLSAKMASVLDSVTDAVFEIDRGWRFTYLNPQARRLLAGGGELLGRNLIEAFPSLRDSAAARRCRWALERGGSAAFHAILAEREFAGRAYPSKDGLAIYFRDVTDERRTARRLVESRSMLAQVIDWMPVGVWVYDAAARTLSCNRAAHGLWAMAQAQDFDAIPVTAYKAWRHDDGRRLGANDWPSVRALRSGEPVLDEEYDIEAFDGTRKAVRTSAVPLRDRGRVIGALVVSEDVSRQKAIEASLQAAKAEAESANVGKSKFLAAASHDLRQPVQSLFLFSSLLLTQLEGTRAQATVGKMTLALEALKTLLDGLLDVSRLDAGVIHPEISVFRLGDVLGGLATEYGPRAADKGLRLRTATCGAMVRSDAGLLGRILRNLLENALRYTESGGILLGCRRRGDAIEVMVCDTGSGIPEDRLQDIFEEFTQLANPTRDHSRGLGLGLAIVRRLSLLLEHTVAVRSTVGHGSCFSIRVPLATTGEGPGSDIAAAARPLPPATVLVLDDDSIVLLSLREMLSSWGLDVVAAPSTEKAIALLRRRAAPDIVIVDFRLRGGQTGMAAVERIAAALGRRPATLVLTGDTAPERRAEAERHGFRLLHKPVLAEELHAVMAELLAQRPAAGEP